MTGKFHDVAARMMFIALFMVFYNKPALAQTLPWVWTPSTEVYTTREQVRIWPNNPVNVITGTVAGSASPPRGPQTQGAWHRVDLKPWGVAADAQWAELSGILLITPGSQYEIANLTVTFRAPGSNLPSDCTKYIGQTSTVPPFGPRSNASMTVPLTNGEFDFCYVTSTAGGLHPLRPSYGINLTLQKWGR
jgi:hypothetical protein